MTGGRDLSPYLDRFGNIAVDVEIGSRTSGGQGHTTGASAKPALVAKFLRELADDIERAGRQAPS